MFLEQLPKDKHQKFFQAAYIAAISSSGAGRDNFRHGCVISYKKDILAVKHNQLKTHPKCLLFSSWPFLHSESSAIIHLGLTQCRKCDIYVIRIKKDNSLGLSKPCSSCNKLIKYVGIKRVYYSTDEGYESYEV